jgi:hypothetical protein
VKGDGRASRAAMQPWRTFPQLFLGLLFVLLPIWIPLGDEVVWTWYAVGMVGAVVIGLLAGRWYRVTTLEQGEDYRVVRVEHLRRRKRAPGGGSSETSD